jgi:DNA-binding MarR family transcriptional regulator
MKGDEYMRLVGIIERLHRQFLEVVKLELDRSGVHDINNVQALLLFNIGPAELTIGELTLRGAYLGSNVSYNVKKMVDLGYLAAQRSANDSPLDSREAHQERARVAGRAERDA